MTISNYFFMWYSTFYYFENTRTLLSFDICSCIHTHQLLKKREGDFNIKKRGCPFFRFFSNLIIHLFWNIPLRFRKNQKTSPFSRWPIAIGHQEIVYTMSGSARTSANQTAAFVLVNKWNSTYKISLLYILCFRHAWIKVG